MENAMTVVNVEAVLVDARSLYERIQRLGDDLVAVARDYVDALDVNPNLRMELQAMGITREMLRRLERLGRGSIAPRLVFAAGAVAHKVMALPLSEQEEILNNGVAVASLDGLDHRMIPMEELSPEQARQCFGDDGVRSLCQQRAWLESEREAARMAEPITPVDVIYKVRGKRVIFTRACEMTARQLAMILAEIEP